MEPAVAPFSWTESLPHAQGTATRSGMRGNGRKRWQTTRGVTLLLLLIWVAVTFGLVFFARELSFDFLGWPFSFWVAAQGALLVYLALVALYAYRSGSAP